MKIFSVHISSLISHIATSMLLLRVKIWPRKSYSNLTQLIIFILLKIGESEIFVHESPEIWCKIRQHIPHDTKYSAKKRLKFCETAGFDRNSCQNVTLFVASCTKTEGNAPSFFRGCWHNKPLSTHLYTLSSVPFWTKKTERLNHSADSVRSKLRGT